MMSLTAGQAELAAYALPMVINVMSKLAVIVDRMIDTPLFGSGHLYELQPSVLLSLLIVVVTD
ncbi:hypothetical protein D3C80_2102460 [compost metagenome]